MKKRMIEMNKWIMFIGYLIYKQGYTERDRKLVPTLFLLIDMDGIIPALEQSPQSKNLHTMIHRISTRY